MSPPNTHSASVTSLEGSQLFPAKRSMCCPDPTAGWGWGVANDPRRSCVQVRGCRRAQKWTSLRGAGGRSPDAWLREATLFIARQSRTSPPRAPLPSPTQRLLCFPLLLFAPEPAGFLSQGYRPHECRRSQHGCPGLGTRCRAGMQSCLSFHHTCGAGRLPPFRRQEHQAAKRLKQFTQRTQPK